MIQDDVYKYTKDYFSILSDSPEVVKLLIIVGPDCVGKSTLVNKIKEKYFNFFEQPSNLTTDKDSKENNLKYIEMETFFEVNIKFDNNYNNNSY